MPWLSEAMKDVISCDKLREMCIRDRFVDPYKFCNEEYESQTIMKKEFLDAALDLSLIHISDWLETIRMRTDVICSTRLIAVTAPIF